MVVVALTNETFLPFCFKPYRSLKWMNEWYTFLNIYEKERKEGWIKKGDVGYVISWFDRNVLQKFGEEPFQCLLVKLRIAVCMVNNISPKKLSPEMKHWFMMCLWDAFKQFEKAYIEWHSKWVAHLPF